MNTDCMSNENGIEYCMQQQQKLNADSCILRAEYQSNIFGTKELCASFSSIDTIIFLLVPLSNSVILWRRMHFK